MKYRNMLLGFFLVMVMAGNIAAEPNDANRPPAVIRRSRARHAIEPKMQRVRFTTKSDFTMQAVASKVTYITYLPATLEGRQKIRDIRYSTPPSRTYAIGDTHYAEFNLRRPGTQFSIEIAVEADLIQNDLSTAMRDKDPNLSKDFDPNTYLRSERYIECDDSAIKQLAETIKAPNAMLTVKKIYETVIDLLTYTPNAQNEIGAAGALRARKGDCNEYADLFVALCRAKGIPARVIRGYVSKSTNIPEHAWARVWLNELGWVRFDPTFGDQRSKKLQQKMFRTLPPIYVALTDIRNDATMEKAITVEGFFVGDIQLNETVTFERTR